MRVLQIHCKKSSISKHFLWQEQNKAVLCRVKLERSIIFALHRPNFNCSKSNIQVKGKESLNTAILSYKFSLL